METRILSITMLRRLKKRKYVSAIFIIAPILLLSACESPHYFVKDESLVKHAQINQRWSKIAILPFSGYAAYRRISSELFYFYMQKQLHFLLVAPAIAELELNKQGIDLSNSEPSLEEATNAGKILGVDAVIVGTIKTKQRLLLDWRPEIGVSLIDISTGKVVATTIQSSPLMFIPNEHKYVVAATEKAADDILLVLNALREGAWEPKK